MLTLSNRHHQLKLTTECACSARSARTCGASARNAGSTLRTTWCSQARWKPVKRLERPRLGIGGRCDPVEALPVAPGLEHRADTPRLLLFALLERGAREAKVYRIPNVGGGVGRNEVGRHEVGEDHVPRPTGEVLHPGGEEAVRLLSIGEGGGAIYAKFLDPLLVGAEVVSEALVAAREKHQLSAHRLQGGGG